MKILIGSAWPYANGSLHIGHLAALLPADVLARYHRAKGDDVYFVSGSDCYGTPVAIRARQEQCSPQDICERYHDEFVYCFEKLGFSFDQYGKTSSQEHRDFVTAFHKRLYNSPFLYEKEAPQAFCPHCHTALADRFVTGLCPACGEKARGDQCDACGAVLEPQDLIEPACAVCGASPEFQQSRHLFLALSKLEPQLRAYLNEHLHWRRNAVAFTERYLNEGLRDRAVTRDLDWGIDVPRVGYEQKKIYIWAENVLGYLSQSLAVCKRRGVDFAQLWGSDAKHYYVHGKDNIPFHTIILPALLYANGEFCHWPDEIVSSEYQTLEGRKISTSQNWAVWVRDLAEHCHPDSLRYFFLANGPERRDADFSFREYVNSHNGELLGAYGNFVNRNLAFIVKYFDGIVPEGELDAEIKEKIHAIFSVAGAGIEQARFRDALDSVFELVRYGNRYFDRNKPWETRTGSPDQCRNTLYNCIQLIGNFSVLLEPFLPFTSRKIQQWLPVSFRWEPQIVPAGIALPQPELLFQRLDRAFALPKREGAQ